MDKAPGQSGVPGKMHKTLELPEPIGPVHWFLDGLCQYISIYEFTQYQQRRKADSPHCQLSVPDAVLGASCSVHLCEVGGSYSS